MKFENRGSWVNQINESSQKNEANGATLLRDMKDFKKWMDTQHKNHPGYYKERKDAINTVIDLLEELYI